MIKFVLIIKTMRLKKNNNMNRFRMMINILNL